MKINDSHQCDEMKMHLSQGEVAIDYIPHLREYGIHVLDGGDSIQQIFFCPWCGKQLPQSLRDEWLEKVWGLGFEPGDQGIPGEMMDERWWMRNGEL